MSAEPERYAENDRFRVTAGDLIGAVGALKGVMWTLRVTFLTIQLDNGEQVQLVREVLERAE